MTPGVRIQADFQLPSHFTPYRSWRLYCPCCGHDKFIIVEAEDVQGYAMLAAVLRVGREMHHDHLNYRGPQRGSVCPVAELVRHGIWGSAA